MSAAVQEARVSVCETFTSIQGESTYAGLPCFFIRLAGCNLRCACCDTPQAYASGRDVTIAELVAAAKESPAAIVEITGGEPLLQRGFALLAAALCRETGKPLLVETNGSRDISAVPRGAVTIMDVKCPGSGEAQSFDARNLARLRPQDEVKFVIADAADYEWARDFVARHKLSGRCAAVLFGAVHGRLDPAALAGWILRDGLDVRLNLQWHRLLGLR